MRASLVIIAIVAAGAGLYWLRDIVSPLALAAFLMVMIDSLARDFDDDIDLDPAEPGIVKLTVTNNAIAAVDDALAR